MRTLTRIGRGRLLAVAVVVLALVALAAVVSSEHPRPAASASEQVAFSPSLDPGTALSGPAPNFTLTDQFDRPVSLSDFRGKVVLLAFNDAQCTTVCPLTTTVMADAKRMLGRAGSRVALLGVNANPRATGVKWVRAYSEVHGLTHLWDFATGTHTHLKRVWAAYHVAVEIAAGQIDHTPALFLINQHQQLERLYLTQMSYASIAQQAQLLAQQVSRLLPGHPAVHSHLSYASAKSTPPTERASLPLAGHGAITVGPGKPRLLLFFASWDQEVMDLRAHLDAMNRYVALAKRRGLPQLLAVDEASVEPSPQALPQLLASLSTPLHYPVAIDSSGALADGYGVQDEPWLELVSGNGTELYFRDLATSGWPALTTLARQLHAALQTSSGPLTRATVRSELSGSPAPLAALHAQASRLIGTVRGLAQRIRSLRGYPVVVNFWASWCSPCRAEFKLFASASARYGRQVAFLGADVNDNAGDARAFLRQHQISYPSYPVSIGQTTEILPAGLAATPTTVFFNRVGKIVAIHTGQYESQGTLDLAIAQHALG